MCDAVVERDLGETRFLLINGAADVASARFRIMRYQLTEGAVSSVGWRLLATNNRDLGQASAAFPDIRACREAVLWLKSHIGEVRVVIVRSGPRSWSWCLVAGERVVAVASRRYQRRIQASQAAGVVLAIIPTAELIGLD